MITKFTKLQRSLALILLGISVYELYIRINASIIPLRMFFNLWIGEGISLEKGLRYVDTSIFHIPLFLISAGIFSLYCVFSKAKVKRSIALLILSGVLIFFAIRLENSFLSKLWQTVILLPLSLIAATAFLQLITKNSD